MEDFEWHQHHLFRKKSVNFDYFHWSVLHILRPVTEICMGFVPQRVWVIGYEGFMGFFSAYPAYQVGDKKSVWDLRDYGLSGPWVKRASTVPTRTIAYLNDVMQQRPPAFVWSLVGAALTKSRRLWV